MARFHRLLVAAPAPEAVAVESDFVVILAALLCALICVVGLIAMARCAWLRRGPVQAPSNKGLKKKALQSLPKFTLGPKFESGECAICLGEFAQGEDVRALPHCAHSFHVACIDTWLASHSSCPSCRQILAVTTACKNCGRLPDAKTPPDTKLAAHCHFIAVLP